MDGLCCGQGDAIAKAWQDHAEQVGAGSDDNIDEGGDGDGDGSKALLAPIAMKFAWDETALKMFIPHQAMQRLFPVFNFAPDGDPPGDVQPAARAKRELATPQLSKL